MCGSSSRGPESTSEDSDSHHWLCQRSCGVWTLHTGGSCESLPQFQHHPPPSRPCAGPHQSRLRGLKLSRKQLSGVSFERQPKDRGLGSVFSVSLEKDSVKRCSFLQGTTNHCSSTTSIRASPGQSGSILTAVLTASSCQGCNELPIIKHIGKGRISQTRLCDFNCFLGSRAGQCKRPTHLFSPRIQSRGHHHRCRPPNHAPPIQGRLQAGSHPYLQ